MNLTEIKGLKYPDDFFIKFFFKNGLHQKNVLHYLEFGCGNGSNLMLPYAYGNPVTGIDYNPRLIAYAEENFRGFAEKTPYRFYAEDMREFVKDHREVEADILSLPNIVNYLSREDFREFLSVCRDHDIYRKNATLFIRWRSPRDFRHGFGQRIGENCYRIDERNDMTGEPGALNTFYGETEMVDLLREHLYLSDFKIFHVEFDNMTGNGDTIFNSDIVLWGTIA